MKILSFISYGHKGTTFESTLLDLPLKKFCKEHGHELINLDIEHLHKMLENERNDLTSMQKVGKHVFQHVTKYDPDVVIMPFGDNDQHNAVIPDRNGAFYIVTREHDKLTPDMLVHTDRIILMNPKQRRALGGRGIKMFPVLNEFLFYPDPEYVTTDESKMTDVSFFGHFTPKRLNFLRYLIDNKVEVKAYGEGWFDAGFTEETTLHGIKVMHRRNATFQRHILTRSKIGLVMADTIKPIHFEVPACGALLVSDSGKSFFRKEEEYLMPIFKTKEVMLQTIKHFLDNPADRTGLATKQKEHVLKKYSSSVFFKKSINKTRRKDTMITNENGESQ